MQNASFTPENEAQEYQEKVSQIITFFQYQTACSLVTMNWSTGLLLATKGEHS